MNLKRIISLLLCLLLLAGIALTGSAAAKEKEPKVVRVGWYESAFHNTDSFGRKSGYGYVYQQRVAIYTGWTYEYVEGSWSELLEMLMAGELDLLTDVSYTPERAEKILYSAEPMGSEGYHVFISPDNREILPDDFSTLNGKKVCVNRNSIQERLFTEWCGEHGVEAEIVGTAEKTPVLLEKLAEGEFDALVTLDTYANTADIVPVWKIGRAESFFGINKNRPDLKKDLDTAMNRLLGDNRDFNQQLAERFNRSGSVSSFVTPEEKKWIDEHGTIRVGYRDGFLPFCGTGEDGTTLTGALADYLKFAETCEKNARLEFETRGFKNSDDAIAALKNGEIDCVFPLSLSAYDGEQLGIVLTEPLVVSEIFATVRTNDTRGISRDEERTVAIVRGNPGYDAFVKDYFPNWKIAHYDDGDTAFRAVASGEADCGLATNYRIGSIGDALVKYKLSPLTTDGVMNAGFAVRREDDSLYSILNKVTRLYPDSDINTSLTRYAFQQKNVTVADLLREHWLSILAVVALVVIVILVLILWNLRTSARMEEGQQIISQAERDPLTGLYNWNFFLIYAGKLNREHPEKHMDAVALNIDRFHSVNALHGRDTGDGVLRELGKEIGNYAEETGSIASRSHADRFNIYCPEGADWQALLGRLQAKMDEAFKKAGIHLRMGVKPWQAGIEPESQFDKARTACNLARGESRNRPYVYDDAMAQREERDQRLLNDLPRALENNELEVYYQPKYDIRGDRPMLNSAEALVRWNHPELGLISPEDFIGLFEKSGQISMLDNFVWEASARQIADWRDRLGIRMPVSVNLSRVDVFDPDLIAKLGRILRKNGLESRDLKLEVTESAYTENASQVIRVIEKLRGKGYEIEMDDFGSGYSSLNMLSSLPVDVLKMDIAFIRNIERNAKDFRLVELIIDIARYLKVPVVAEGVETENQLRLLKNAGCDIVQGYYFSRPLAARAFEEKIFGRG